jgi:hypothetical protein
MLMRIARNMLGGWITILDLDFIILCVGLCIGRRMQDVIIINFLKFEIIECKMLLLF